ncbi:Pyrimidine-specific ribonucleoside hydrolase RihA [Bacillus sp. THAF10]|nr:Pyrimidine-specific ribonucleoside hydrolase RihA [Bacillus sp. THAF10]
MKKIILFADTGIDDAISIIYALQNPDLDVLAIVAGYGNTDRDKSARNAAYLLELAGRKEIPIIAGSTRPLSGQIPEFFPDIHGAEGLGPIVPPISSNRFKNRTNFSLLFEIIKENRNDVTIVNVGRCTSLAIAWYLSPSVMSLVKETYIMGGAFLEPGNVTEVAEANFFGDPIAANFVAQNAPNLTIIPLNVTRKAILTPALVNYIDSVASTPLQQIIKPILDFYYEAYQELEPGISGTPQHDLAAVMASLQIPGLFIYTSKQVKVEYKEGFADGLSIADFRPGAEECSGTGCVKIATDINENIFIANTLRILTRR